MVKPNWKTRKIVSSTRNKIQEMPWIIWSSLITVLQIGRTAH